MPAIYRIPSRVAVQRPQLLPAAFPGAGNDEAAPLFRRLPPAIDLSNPVSDHELNSGLRAWWLGLDNVAGGATVDLLNNFTSDVFFTQTWNEAPNGFGVGYYNNAISNYAKVSAPSTVYPFTVSMWARPAAFTGAGVLWWLGQDGVAVWNAYYAVAQGGSQFNIVSSNNNDFAGGITPTGPTLSNGVWYHLTAVFTSATSRTAYVNGLPAGTGTGSCTPPNVNTLYLARDGLSGTTNYYGGDIGDTRFYNRALGDAEVFSLYEQSARRHPDTIRRTNTSVAVVGGYTVPVPAASPTPRLPSAVDLSNPVADHELNVGLVAWWLGLDNVAGGSNWIDIAGRRALALANSPPWRTHTNGSAGVDFNGSSQYGQCSLDLSAWSIVTVGFWLWADSWATTAGNYNMLFELTADAATNSGGMALYNGGLSTEGLTAVHSGATGAVQRFIGTRPATGAWWHVIWTGDFTKSSDETGIYINGVAQAITGGPTNTDNTSGSTYASSTFNVGARNAASLFFDGSIVDIRIRGWARTPSATDLYAEYLQALNGHPDTIRRIPNKTASIAAVAVASAADSTPPRRRSPMATLLRM